MASPHNAFRERYAAGRGALACLEWIPPLSIEMYIRWTVVVALLALRSIVPVYLETSIYDDVLQNSMIEQDDMSQSRKTSAIADFNCHW